MSSAKKLFLVVLGGRCKGCHVEQHDVRWVVGETIDATLPALRQEWIGLRRGLHIDSYRCIDHVDGYRVEVVEQAQDPSSADGPQLWFVNLGAYDPTSMAEQHAFGVIVARSSASAKARARQRWLQGTGAGAQGRSSPCRQWTAHSMICCRFTAMASGT